MSDSPDPAQVQVQVQAHAHDGDRLLMERVLLFCDAVYAIVITLLALEIRLPEPAGEGGWSDAALLHALAELAPKFMGYFISFAVIALLWLGHLRRYRLLRAVDGRSAALLLVQLAFVGLLPFFTSLLAEAPTRTAIVMYAGNLVVAAAAGLAAWRHASGLPGCAGAHLTPRARRRETLAGVALLAIFLLSIPLAFVAPRLAMASWALAWPLLALVRRTSAE